jgi:hypothetical protein
MDSRALPDAHDAVAVRRPEEEGPSGPLTEQRRAPRTRNATARGEATADVIATPAPPAAAAVEAVPTLVAPATASNTSARVSARL